MTNETNIETPVVETAKSKSTKSKSKPATKKTPVVKTFTTADLAREFNVTPKTLRAKVRRKIDELSTHMIEKHVYANKSKRQVVKILALSH